MSGSIRHALLGVGVTGLMLASCGDSEESLGPCPSTGVLSDAAKIVKFAPGGSEEVASALIAAEVVNTTSGCRYDGTDITAGVGLAIEAVVGQAGAKSRQLRYVLPYFVAVTDANDRVLSKREFEATLRLKDNTVVRVLEIVDDIEIKMPAGKTGADYRVIVGFQLTPAQLDYNRRQRRR